MIFIINEISHLMLGAPFSKYMKLINTSTLEHGSYKLELKTVIKIELLTENYTKIIGGINKLVQN
jgi:hypothetical protein